MVIELMRSYVVLLVVMILVMMGFLMVRFFFNGEFIYIFKFLRKGYCVRIGRFVVFEIILVGEIMSRDFVYVIKDMIFFDVEYLIGEIVYDCFFVVDENFNVVGIIGIKDILKKLLFVKRLKVERFLNRVYVVIYLIEMVEVVFEKLMVYD